MKIAFNPSTVEALIAPPNNKDITFDLRGHNIFARGVKFCGTDTNTWRDIKINNVSIDSNILDLRDGDNTTLTNINGVVTINSTWRPVVDNLTSDSTTSSLSANLGRILKALIDGKSDSDHNHDDRYLRLTGGWMSGDINFGGDNKIYWGRNTDSASISFKNDGDGDADSYMSFVTSDNGNEYFRWSHSSGSTNTEWMALRSDGLRVGGTKVSLEGHSHNDLYYTKTEVNNKLNGKSDSDHNHDGRYVKKSGDTMLGALNFANATWNLVGDDVYIGDRNIAGQLCIMGANGTTGLSFHKYGDDSIRRSITFNGSTLYMNGNCDYASLANLSNLLAINTVPNETTSTSVGSWSPISGRYVFHQKWNDTSTGNDSADFGIYLDGNLTANMVLDGYYNSLLGFRVIGATSGFLKANGTIDNSTYLTSHLSLSNYYTKSEVDTKLNSKLNYRLFWERTNIDLNSITEAWHTYEVNNGLGTANTPTDAIWHLAVLWGTGDTDYAVLLCTAYTSNYSLYLRHKIAGTWYPWIQLAAITDIPLSLKNPHALTISLNGTSQGPYDGSATKNINITPSSIGAATSDHNHDGRYVRYYAVTTLDCNNLAVGLTAAEVSATNAAHTNHSAFLYISDVGTPFQIQIPDSSVPYIYKRYYSSGTWSGWFKLNAGYADSAGSAIRLTSLGDYTYDNLSTDIPTNAVSYKIVTSGGTDLGDSQYNVLHIPWSSGDWGTYLLFGANNGRFGVKYKHSGIVREVLDSSNYTSILNNTYLPLAGGTMNGNARIGHGSGNLYIGNSGNDGWIYTQDIASLLGTASWNIRTSGAARFGRIHIASKNDESANNNVIESDTDVSLHLNYFNNGNITLCNGGGNVGIGTTSPSSKLTVNGVGNDQSPVQLVNSSRNGTWVYTASFLAPNLTSNNNNAIFIGKAHSTCNAFGLTHMHIGDGSVNNYAALEVWGVGNVLRWYYDRHSSFLHRVDFSSLGSDASYMNSALLIRENGYNGAQADTWANAPRMSWHWSGRVLTQIGLASNNELYLSKNNFDNAYKLVYETGTWGINISGNAASATKSEYSRSLLGRSTSGNDYDTNSANLVFAEWNTMSDNRWYLKATGYECRVAYANNAGDASRVYGYVGDTGSHELVRCDMNNDQFRIIAGSNGNNNGWAEIATADDGSEPIYVRQYTGVFSSVVRTLTLLDANGYTHFPSYINIGGNENNNSSPDRVWGSNSSDSYLRSYRTSALRVAHANTSGLSWNVPILGQHWSRLFAGIPNIMHHSSIFSISGSIGCVVFCLTFLVESSHAGSATINCLFSGSYTQPKVRALAKSDGTVLVDLFWSGNDCSLSSSTQQMTINVIANVLLGSISPITTLTNDDTIPNGYSNTCEFLCASKTSNFYNVSLHTLYANSITVNHGGTAGIYLYSSSGESSYSMQAKNGKRWVAGAVTDRYFIWNDTVGAQFNITNSGNVGIGTDSPTEKLHINNGLIKIEANSRYLRIGPQNSSHTHYETNADVSHWFNKRVDVNGAIWRYNTNYGIASDGYFYAKGVYANRDGSQTLGGVSLYSTSDPMTYGIALRGTGTYGTHGYVTSANDWATYLTMNDDTTRGWIFRRGDTNVASIAGSGNMAIGLHLEFSNGAHISTNRSTDYHYGYTFNLGDNAKSIGMYSGPVGEAGGVVISPDGCLIYNSSDCGYNLQVRDKDLGSDLTNIATLTFGIELSGYYAWSRGGFKKNGSSDSYVLLGGGGHQTISSLSVNYANSAGNADTLDGEHASNFVRAGNFESVNLNSLDTYSFIKSVNSTVASTSPKGNTGWYNVILAVHRNGGGDGPSYIGLIALGMTTNIDGMFYRTKYNGSWYAWHEVVTTNTGLLRYSRNNVNISSPNCSPIPPSLLEWTIGYPRLYDPEFNEGYNNVYVYNNAGNGVVTVTRVHDTNVGNSSSYIIKVVSAVGAIPNYGGWHVATLTELGKVYTCLFRASIPSGVEIEWNSNSIGTGGLMSWLTNNMGTGKWTWYAVLVYCGSGGSTTFYFSAKSPCTWYLSYVNVIENNRASYAGLRSVYSDYLKVNASIVFGRNELLYFNQYTSVTTGATNNANPKTDWYHILRMNHANSSGYFVDLAIPFHDNRILFRRITNGSDNGWSRVITEEPNHNVLLCDGSGGGSVGIGISSPSYKLDVNGLIKASGFIHSDHSINDAVLLAGGGYERIFKLGTTRYYNNTSYELSFHKLSGLCNNLVWVDGCIWNSTSTSFLISSDFYPYLYANSSSMRTIYRMDGNNMITVDGNGIVVISCSGYPRRIGFFYTGRA